MRPELLEAVCFDIGGTLVRMERGTLAEEIVAHLGVDGAVVRDLLIQHGKRKRTTPADLAAVVAEGCGRSGDADTVAQILRRRQADISQPRLYDDALPVLRALAGGGWRILYLSNAVGYVDAGPEPGYYSYAELVLHSWEIGACTPDPAAFRAVVGRTGLRPSAIVHVGDSWESDVVGALAAGWQAIHLSRHEHKSPASHAGVPRIASLAELAGLLPRQPVGRAAAGAGGRG